jgi:integrase
MSRVYFRNERWCVDYSDASGQRVRRVLAKSVTSKKEAQSYLSELVAQAGRILLGLESRPVRTRQTLGQLVEWWLENHASLEVRRAQGPGLKKHVIQHHLGRHALGVVTPDALEQRFRELDLKLAPATVNRIRGNVSSAFEYARKPPLSYQGQNPVTRTSQRKVLKRDVVALTPSQIALMLVHSTTHWRPILALAAYLGLRKGEIFALTKRDWDQSNSTLKISKSHDKGTKTGKTRVLPVPRILVPILREALLSDSIFLCPNSRGKQMGREADPQKAVRLALARAGILGEVDFWCVTCKKSGRLVVHQRLSVPAEDQWCQRHDAPVKKMTRIVPGKFTFHQLRHTCASNLLRSGVELFKVSKILGHAGIRITADTYGHLVTEDLRSALDASIWHQSGTESASGKAVLQKKSPGFPGE